ncbi:MAG: aminotransferase class III-fold pyridoxal phosphate-dependent enzyme [Gemmatimonadota bacterium]|nr:aminotransferase class III-fold pyridoxal phosphate-dependent enzyme [Gemmatimonadota bacterium]
MPDSISSTIVAQRDVLQHEEHARTWRERADAVLPTGASTGSKRAAALYGDEFSDAPTHFATARGCRVTDMNGDSFVDCTMALGAVSLGYAEPRVTNAVIAAASEGSVAGLSSWREVELAERLCAVIPCAERAQFLKSGAEAVSAAVRLSRTYTGRNRVVASGYFGWHDWSSNSGGVPEAVREDVVHVPFGDVSALERAARDAGRSLAAIVLEPVVEQEPPQDWIVSARALCDELGAALVFDEVKTGFRLAPGGYQQVCGVTPDLAAFGKALANGYPLAAVVGKAPLMDAARRTWISSTLASEATGLAAALVVLDWHDETDVCAKLASIGHEMRAAVERAITATGARGARGVRTNGVDAMWLLHWDDAARENRFVREALAAGVLFKRGAYNFAAIAHDEDALAAVEHAASTALTAVRGDTD